MHALDQGVRKAKGDWLLFADADIRLSPRAVARAIAYAEAHGLDLVSAYPQIESAGFWGDVAWSYIGTLAGVAIAPDRLRNPDSPHAISIGAFILIRRSAFEATPGFSYIKLEVADDMGLAILMKDHDFRCDIVNGRGEVRLTWYTSLRDMVVRSQKNFFGILCRFSFARGLALAALTAMVGLFPLLALVPSSSPFVAALPFSRRRSSWRPRWCTRAGRRAHSCRASSCSSARFSSGSPSCVRPSSAPASVGSLGAGVLYPSALLRSVQRFKM